MKKIWLNKFDRKLDLKNCVLLITDGGGNEMEVRLGGGNLTFSEKRNIIYNLDRGRLDDVSEGDEVPVDVKFDFEWTYIRGSGTLATIDDALKQQGAASAWVSSDVDTCRPYAVDLQFLNNPKVTNPTCVGDMENIYLHDFRWESLDHDAKNATVSCSGKCNILEVSIYRGSSASDESGS